MKYFEVKDADGLNIRRVPEGKTLADLGCTPEQCAKAKEVSRPATSAATVNEADRMMVSNMTVGELKQLISDELARGT
jgi:hypothetical protein